MDERKTGSSQVNTGRELIAYEGNCTMLLCPGHARGQRVDVLAGT